MLPAAHLKGIFKLAVIPTRLISTTSTQMLELKFGEHYIPKKLELEKMPANYKEHPERDLVNFPREEQRLWSPKHRLGFIPDSWFQFFYNKTGVTGPYILGVGAITFALSKEFYVINGMSLQMMVTIFYVYIGTQYLKKPLAEYMDKYFTEKEKPIYAWRENIVKKLTARSEEMKDLVKCSEAWAPMVYQAQRENYFMAMEAEYRRRLDEYQHAIKRKLNYFVDLQDAKLRYQRRHVVDWVVDQVKNSITDSVQKATLAQCVVNLKTLSQKASI